MEKENDSSLIDIIKLSFFKQNNLDIKTRLERASSDVYDMITDLEDLKERIFDINSKLASLRTTTIPSIPHADDLEPDLNAIVDYMKEKVTKTIVSLDYIEATVEEYNGEGDANKNFPNIYRDMLAFKPTDEDYLFTIALLPEQKYRGIEYLLLFNLSVLDYYKKLEKLKTAKNNEGIIPSQYAKVFSKIPKFKNIVESNLEINIGGTNISSVELWQKATKGALIKASFTFAKDLYLDKGDITSLDRERISLDAAAAGLSGVAWTTLEGSIAGPPGVIVAFAATVTIDVIADKIVDRIVGDDIVHSFEYDGREYTVPRNGNGKNGTADVFKEVIDNQVKGKTLAGKTYSKSNYKRMLYTDWRELTKLENPSSADDYLHVSNGDKYSELLSKVVEFSDRTKALEYYYNALDDNINLKNIDAELSMYGFDINEYIAYQKGGYLR